MATRRVVVYGSVFAELLYLINANYKDKEGRAGCTFLVISEQATN